MAKYVRTSKCLQRICWESHLGAEYRELRQREEKLCCWPRKWTVDHRELILRHHEDVFCCFLPALQESKSLKELDMELPLFGGSSNLAFENMLTHTHSLQSLTLIFPVGLLEDRAVAAAWSGLKKNTTLRELTLVLRDATTFSPSLTSLRHHPLLQRLCLCGPGVDLNGLQTVLLSDTSKITELDIHWPHGGPPMMGLMHILQALARRPTLTKPGLHNGPLGHDEARQLVMVLRNTPCLQTLVLTNITLRSAGLEDLALALYHNTSIKVLDVSGNNLNGMESAETLRESARLLRDLIRYNKTLATLDLSGRNFSGTSAAECIADGLGSNSTLLKINLSSCRLRDNGVATLLRNLDSRNTTLQTLKLRQNSITSTGVGVLLETISHIKDLDLQRNLIRNEGASLLARSMGSNALPNLTCLSLSQCGIGDVGFIALVSALEQNSSLLHLDLSDNIGLTERAFLALAGSLPEIKVLQRADFNWRRGLASAMPLLLAGLRKNTSLFRIQVTNCAPSLVPPSPDDTARCAGGWIQEMEYLGYRNCFRHLIRAPKERLPPRGVWPHALVRVASLPDVIF